MMVRGMVAPVGLFGLLAGGATKRSMYFRDVTEACRYLLDDYKFRVRLQ